MPGCSIAQHISCPTPRRGIGATYLGIQTFCCHAKIEKAMVELDEAPHRRESASALANTASWEPQGIARNLDLAHFVSAAIKSPLPPWRPIPSRAAAQMLGTSLQSLANWRMRDLGPTPEPMKQGRGNRIYYRPDRIAEWISGGRCADWQLSRSWLQEKGMISANEIDEDLVRTTIGSMEKLDLFPAVHRLWRSFRPTE
jgi:hypothetical protein